MLVPQNPSRRMLPPINRPGAYAEDLGDVQVIEVPPAALGDAGTATTSGRVARMNARPPDAV